MSKRVTRNETDCPILGSPCLINKSMLPTTAETLKHIIFVRNEEKLKGNGKQPSISEVIDAVASDLIEVWTTASLPIVTKQRVKQMLKSNYDKYLHFLRYPKSKQTENYIVKLQEWKQKCVTELFDICSCKCIDFNTCSCPRGKRVPALERAFLYDQRHERKMAIGSLDRTETKILEKKFARKLKSNLATTGQEKNSKKKAPSFFMPSESCCTPELIALQPSTSKTLDSHVSLLPLPNQRNRLSLPTLATVCDRYGISDRSAAAVASAVLQDVGLITSENADHVIDRSKIRRARNRVRYELQSHENFSEISGIYFDGRKDKTLVFQKRGQRLHKTIATKEHISLIREPGSLYLGHLTTLCGTGKAIADSINSFFTKNDMNLNNLLAIGCDGTATNTGWKSGVIRFIELKLGRLLQWFICQMHANELPLRHLFTKLDGATSGPQLYSGPIGKALENCANLPVTEFSAIPSNMPVLPKEIENSLSTDQKYLYHICQAVSSGSCCPDLSNRNPGKMAHSRWLTTANRILRLYVATPHPSTQLIQLTEYIVKVYAPVWFCIKKESSFKQGPIHVYKLIEFSRCLSSDVKKIINPVIQRNSFFAHPENLLLAMLYDNRPHIKELALRRIITSRKNTKSGLRIFKVPKINFEANDYTDLIVWSESQVTSPPMLKDISDNELEDLVASNSHLMMELPDYPCHTQAVERCVKMVTEASITVAGEKARDGFIRAKIKSREIMPYFETKKNFKVQKKSE